MRRLCSRMLALGLAAGLLSVVPTSAEAGKPKCPHSTGAYKCPSCQLADAQRKAGDRPIIVTGASPIEHTGAGCAACAASGGEGVIVMESGEAPGVARLGGAHPGGVVMPGGYPITGEPTPIGMVRAGYDLDARQTSYTGATFDPTHGPSRAPSMMSAPGMGMGMGMPPGAIPPAPTPMDSQARRTSILGHLFGLDGIGRYGESRAARRAAEHAAIPMGAPAGAARPTELPASMVYGR